MKLLQSTLCALRFLLSDFGVSIPLYVPAERLAFWATFILLQGEALRLSERSYDVEPQGDACFS
jgi:hypothetical protein